MKTKTLINMLGSALLLLGLTTATTPSAQAQGKVKQRNIQDWLDAQGTLFPPSPLLPETPAIFLFNNNPDINGDGVDDGQRYIVFYDYAAVLGRPTSYEGQFAPTSVTGKLTERPIGNGLAEVTAQVQVSGALIWVTTWDPANQNNDWLFHDGPTVFGHRETELLADPTLDPALAEVNFTCQFLNEVGAPMPDLIATLFAGPFPGRFLSFHVSLRAEGPLTAAFGVPEGTPGKLVWGNPGLLSKSRERARRQRRGQLVPARRVPSVPDWE